MKDNSILDIIATCIGLIFVGPIIVFVFTHVIPDDLPHHYRRIVWTTAMLISLGICVGVTVGIRLVIENIVDRVKTFPTVSSFAFKSIKLLLLFVFLCILVFISISILTEPIDFIMACLCFFTTYYLSSAALSMYVS